MILKRTSPGQPRARATRSIPRATAGSAVLALALFLLMLLRSGGTGSDEKGTADPDTAGGLPMVSVTGGERKSDGQSPVVPEPEVRQSTDGQATDGQADDGLTADERDALAGSVLTILIDEHDCLIQVTTSQNPRYAAATMDRILELAERTVGDANGIRVRILRRESARARTEEDLKLELARHGIGSDAVHMSDQFVP